jgi:excisionase family DNA binding protein
MTPSAPAAGPSLLELEWHRWPYALTLAQAAEVLNVDRRTVLKLIVNGALEELPFPDVNRRQVSRASIVALLKLA